MKVTTALLCLLLSATTFNPKVLVLPAAVPSTCCFTVNSKKISPQRLTSYRITSSTCSLKAVIFRTKWDKEFCADYNQKWVQNLMKYLERRSQTPKP